MAIIGAERKILSKAEIDSIIGLFRKKLETEKVLFEKLYLFGSYASSEADRDSDIDVAVILPVEYRDKNLDDSIRLWGKEINVKIEAQTLFSDDFENRYLSLPAYIKKLGLIY